MILEVSELKYLFWNLIVQFFKVFDVLVIVANLFVFHSTHTFTKLEYALF
jgi:hypothetical protein